MIFEWSKDWGATFEEELTKKWQLDNIISFSKDDVRRIQTLHDDAVVISMTIANYDVKKNLVDNESSTDILFYWIFFRMWLPTDQLRRVLMPLVGFVRDVVIMEEKITLPPIVETDP